MSERESYDAPGVSSPRCSFLLAHCTRSMAAACWQWAALAPDGVQLAETEACLVRSFVQGYDERDPKTHKGYNLRKMPMGAVYKEYGLDPMTVDFIGHAIALHRRANCPRHLAAPHSFALLHAYPALWRCDWQTRPCSRC